MTQLEDNNNDLRNNEEFQQEIKIQMNNIKDHIIDFKKEMKAIWIFIYGIGIGVIFSVIGNFLVSSFFGYAQFTKEQFFYIFLISIAAIIVVWYLITERIIKKFFAEISEDLLKDLDKLQEIGTKFNIPLSKSTIREEITKSK